MSITWSFLVIFVVIIVPGLFIRRLFFFGEFSKQFGQKEPLLKITAYAIMPGMFNVIIAFLLFDLIKEVDLGEVIDTYKLISNESTKFQDIDGNPLTLGFKDQVLPFLGFLYLIALIIGSISGRIIKITGFDTKFKILRFSNSWFYLFNGNQLEKLKKYSFLNSKREKFLFTEADVLLELSSGPRLYSGMVVDYELKESDCQSISKLVLRKAKRYKDVKGKMEPRPIPGDILIVDCSSLKNLNLSFVYAEQKKFLDTYVPKFVTRALSLLSILIIPLLVFKSDRIEFNLYKLFFELNWIGKFFIYFFIIQVLKLFNPFIENKAKGSFRWVNLDYILVRLILVLLIYYIAAFANYIGNLVLNYL